MRGGINLVSRFSPQEKARGVVAASTGNHGQSIAHAARLFGTTAVICAPAGANPVKVEAMEGLGAEVVLEGASFDEAKANAERLAREHGYRYVHSGDEPLLIAGVGTHTLEILAQEPRLDTILVPVGGGSGAAGAAIVAKQTSPSIRVIGVQSERSPAAHTAWVSGEHATAPNRTRAEGLATGQSFDLPQRILGRLLDDFLLVTDEDLDEACRILIEKTRTLVEAAGAAALAGALKLDLEGRRVGLIVSGGNLSPAQLAALYPSPPRG